MPDLVGEMFHQIAHASTIGISGHSNPDGDCVGACLALCTYLKENYPEKRVDVFLEPIRKDFLFLQNAEDIRQEKDPGRIYDLYFSLDCSEPERLEKYQTYFEESCYKICIDHHVTNKGFGHLSFIEPEASSTCEILFDLFDCDRISLGCAEALYMGILHDTGVFKHSNTTKKVMEIAGALIEKGVNTEMIQDKTFFKKTYLQNQILGRALIESVVALDGRMIFSSISAKDISFYGVEPADFDGIIDQLRVTEGVKCALFMYEKEVSTYKVSLRSSDDCLDVSKIAASFGGGGHKKAAGCTVYGKRRDIIMNIAELVEEQLDGAKE